MGFSHLKNSASMPQYEVKLKKKKKNGKAEWKFVDKNCNVWQVKPITK